MGEIYNIMIKTKKLELYKYVAWTIKIMLLPLDDPLINRQEQWLSESAMSQNF